jgi:hypothetical protein
MHGKQPCPSVLEWLIPAFFTLVGIWYLFEWALTSPASLTFRAGVGGFLLVYGSWRLMRLWRQKTASPTG